MGDRWWSAKRLSRRHRTVYWYTYSQFFVWFYKPVIQEHFRTYKITYKVKSLGNFRSWLWNKKSFDICEQKDGSKKAMLLLDLKPTLFNIEPIECSNRKEIICVVDRSGSMSGTAMRNAKEALKMFIRFRDSRTYLRTRRSNWWCNIFGPNWGKSP